MSQESSRNESAASRAVISVVDVIGISIFTYAVCNVVISPFNVEWASLSLVTVLIVARTDIYLPKISSTVTLDDTFIYISMLLYGVAPSVVLAGLNAAACSLHYKNKRKVLPFNVAVMSLSVFASGTLVTAIFGPPGDLEPSLSHLILAAESLALIHYGLNSGMVSIVNALRGKRNILKAWRESFLWSSISYFAGAVAACLVVKLVALVSFYSFIIAVPILGITYLTYKNYLDKVKSSIDHAQEMADLHLRTIEALAIAIDAKDEVTHDHVHRVQIYATGLARLFGLSDHEIQALKAGALLHDIGKLAVPDYILNKPGKLTPAEYDKMKVHTIVGAEILERVQFPYPVVPTVRHHHERWDGRGYPDGLKGEQIPVTARILSVVDCFDAVREDRQYRKAMTRDEAVELLKANSGTMYDPQVVSTFLKHLPEFEAEIRRQKMELQEERGRVEGKTLPRQDAGDSGVAVFQQIRSAHREVITLYEIAQTISTSLDLRDTFAVFSSRLQDIVSYTTCVLYLTVPDSTDVQAAHVSGHNAERFKDRRIASGVGITGWVVANRMPMYNSDPRLDFDALRLEMDEQYRSSVVVPLTRDGELSGALALYSKDPNPYKPDDLRLVEAVAKLASDAIANALHHERVETNALTDALTGLANARALRHQFEQRVEQARRHGEKFSVLMMDLDGFKAVNDSLGHQVGDDTLREVARLLLSQVRSSDFLCRYAGDEFVAIVQVEPAEMIHLINRLQQAVNSHAFSFGNASITIGLSVGSARHGADGDTLDELLLAADRAMYADKFKRKALFAESNAAKKASLNSYRVM
jgi:diguanylate cyclase (GGDEF)-like protein/putative nucleotidyltransferase with HDIG domain